MLDSVYKTRCSRPALAAWWSDYLEEERQVMYEKVSSKTLKATYDRNLTSESCSEDAVAALAVLSEKLEAIAPLDKTVEEPAIIFYVDEAYTLMAPPSVSGCQITQEPF